MSISFTVAMTPVLPCKQNARPMYSVYSLISVVSHPIQNVTKTTLSHIYIDDPSPYVTNILLKYDDRDDLRRAQTAPSRAQRPLLKGLPLEILTRYEEFIMT